MKNGLAFILLTGVLVACAHGDLLDPHWVLDPPNNSLRGPAPKDDRPESDCDPVKKYSCDPKQNPNCDLNKNPPCDPVHDSQCTLKLSYQCVVHTIPNYQALIDKIIRLEAELKDCQSGKGIE